jgi:hypothetical protein
VFLVVLTINSEFFPKQQKIHTEKYSGNQRIEKWPVGKSSKSWVNAVNIDSREILNVRNWKRESLHGQVWRRRLKEANARYGALCRPSEVTPHLL